MVSAYQMLEQEKQRHGYLNRLRLRSLASQYLQIAPLINDGFFYPFYIFIVLFKNEQRMLELNFVEDILLDNYKDHCRRSYHFSMIKRVNKGVKANEILLEFNQEKFIYEAMVPGQRDFIVAMLKTAQEEAQIAQRKNKGVNCPDNHNLKKQGGDLDCLSKFLKLENNLQLSPIMNDFVPPHKSLMKGNCRKKNRTMGYETRYLLLGISQLLISRDPDF